jgi:hypothetical protein
MSEHWAWPPLFLEALSASGLVRASARAVRIGRRTVYDKRERDPEFAAALDEALAPFRDGKRPHDRHALARFPKHAALAPLDKVSADAGAVSVAELEAKFGCSLDELADNAHRSYPARGDVETWDIIERFAEDIRALAARADRPGITHRPHRGRHAVAEIASYLCGKRAA